MQGDLPSAGEGVAEAKAKLRQLLAGVPVGYQLPRQHDLAILWGIDAKAIAAAVQQLVGESELGRVNISYFKTGQGLPTLEDVAKELVGRLRPGKLSHSTRVGHVDPSQYPMGYKWLGGSEVVTRATVRELLEELAPGDPVPSARVIARALGVGYETAITVLRELRDDGRLVNRPGEGFFVTSPEEAKRAIDVGIAMHLRSLDNVVELARALQRVDGLCGRAEAVVPSRECEKTRGQLRRAVLLINQAKGSLDRSAAAAKRWVEDIDQMVQAW